MTPEQLVATVVPAALAYLPEAMRERPAVAQLVGIALQESGLRLRRQIGSYRRDRTPVYGPARGWWQFERDGGTAAVLEHRASRDHAGRVCDERGLVGATLREVHLALEHDDVLACVFARLLLWTDPRALPQSAEDHALGWAIYLATWRPGKPKTLTWPSHVATGWRVSEGWPA